MYLRITARAAKKKRKKKSRIARPVFNVGNLTKCLEEALSNYALF